MNENKIQWTGKNMYEVIEFTEASDDIVFPLDRKIVIIESQTHPQIAEVGDYIVRNEDGIFAVKSSVE